LPSVTLLSVIVPVHQVEDYLADCLDSILDQSFRDVELVAVDDASTDGCARILSRYAERDPRVVVVTLDHNQGLGAARNAGLARATGTYVWFVDSDDWLPEGALGAVAARLLRTGPDLLVTAYTRHYPDGGLRHCGLSQVGAGRPVPETFTLRQYPALLAVLHITCNKVIRRRFLAESGLTFGSGWYEDVSFSFPLLLAAGRISLLDRGCYAYRQRAGGAITSTVSPRHFEAFEHWDRVLTGLDRDPAVPAVLRHLIFERPRRPSRSRTTRWSSPGSSATGFSAPAGDVCCGPSTRCRARPGSRPPDQGHPIQLRSVSSSGSGRLVMSCGCGGGGGCSAGIGAGGSGR